MPPLLTGSLHLDRLTVPITNLPDRLQGLKIIQLSDFHYDRLSLSEDLLNEAIVTANQASPDLIVLTGDFISYQPDPIYPLAQRLKALRSRYGTFAVLGNHDLLDRKSRIKITAALGRAEIPVLWNEVRYPCGNGLALVGLPDFWSKEFDPRSVLETIEPTIPRLLLSHNPDSAEVLKQWRVDLQLSGHTHGGQIVLPGIGNLAAIAAQQYDHIPTPIQKAFPVLKACQRVVKNWNWAQGLHRVGDNLLYVNRGLGSYPPGRLFCPPEITLITLNSA